MIKPGHLTFKFAKFYRIKKTPPNPHTHIHTHSDKNTQPSLVPSENRYWYIKINKNFRNIKTHQQQNEFFDL